MSTPDPIAPALWISDLPGIGGRLKVEPDDFVVEEISRLNLSGSGEHLFLWIEKRGVPADRLLEHVADSLAIDRREIGCGGLKDARAVTRQFLSVPEAAESRLASLETDAIRVLDVFRHGHKLRTSDLAGNRFRILIRDPEVSLPIAMERAQEMANRLALGVPNYFGPQRFGHEGATWKLGRALVRKEKRVGKNRFLKRLALSAFQSLLFNDLLTRRIEDGLLMKAIDGDVMEFVGSGMLSVVGIDEHQEAQVDYDARRRVPTGPMLGPKMRRPRGDAARREQAVMDAHEVGVDDFERFGKLASGARRALLLWPKLRIEEDPNGVVVCFELPPGSYATVVLREIIGNEG